jgi:hypothetical protein
VIDRLTASLSLPLLVLSLGTATAKEPLSASDWLSGSLRSPARESSAWRPGDKPPPGLTGAAGNPRPVAETGAIGKIEVTRLSVSDLDSAGTLTAERAGLPEDLWQGSSPEDLSRLLLATPSRLPAMSDLLVRVLTAQLAPPVSEAGNGGSGSLFLARADRLLDMGALDQAAELLLVAGPSDPGIFQRLFDIALLEGDEGRACTMMNTTPGIAPSFTARIFCLAQTGDWAAAAISLRGAETLGLIDEAHVALMTHFLDDAFVDAGEIVEPVDPMTPLDFRIHEAIGQPLPTAPLPLAFAQSDLRANNGWKARLEAAERLARAGAISGQRLRDIYAEQKPAASGGVWERAGAMRALESAVVAQNPAAALPHAFDEFRRADMAGVLAAMIAADLPESGDGRAGEIAGWLRQWQALPVSNPVPIQPELLTGSAALPATQKGEALLTAMADIDAGIEGDLARAGRGIAMLRALGLTAEAELAATQLTLRPMMSENPG